MAKLHLGIGTLFFIAFLLTGAYMLSSFPDLYAGREEVRMMYRATHIYILLASLLNVMAGNLLLAVKLQKFKWIRHLSSIALMLSPALFLYAFFTEPPVYNIDRHVSFFTMIALASAIGLLSVTYWLERYSSVKDL